jgi:large subunit ribosomal protein L25
MAELLKLNVQERTQTGKGPNRRLRLKEMVPGIYYDQKGTNIAVQVKLVPLQKAYAKLGNSQVFDLVLERDGKTETMPALLWRVRNEPVTGLPEHVDFFGIDLTKDIKVSVHYELTGTSKGIKLGGRLEQFRDSIEVICKPMNIPESIVIDITELDMLDSIHIEDIAFPEGVTPVFDENYAVLHISGELEDEEEGEGEEAAE